MKNHTQEFKEQIKNLGRQQDVIIEYTINDSNIRCIFVFGKF